MVKNASANWKLSLLARIKNRSREVSFMSLLLSIAWGCNFKDFAFSFNGYSFVYHFHTATPFQNLPFEERLPSSFANLNASKKPAFLPSVKTFLFGKLTANLCAFFRWLLASIVSIVSMRHGKVTADGVLLENSNSFDIQRFVGNSMKKFCSTP